LRLRLEHSPSDHERLCSGHHHETEKQRKVQSGGSDTSAGSTGPLVTVVVADHNRTVAALYRALADHKVQVRSLMAA
jgi:hypothetical protein